MKKAIPTHLKPFVSQQHYNAYSPIDHAVWRYVMRQNHHFLENIAHEAFTTGLKSSGIDIDNIPKVKDMNEKLSKIGWGAVIVDGLIPGSAFFDLQAHGILPIATDIRQKSNIEYTPAPDILHEAAGHAPILFNETYSKFVKLIGHIGANAFATKEEHEVFEATRELSIVMEDPSSSQSEIDAVKKKLKEKQAAVTGLSESEQISRIFWWTVEFGLIGDLQQPKIFGAGLLSSVGESKHCLSNEVEKRRFTIEDAAATSYDVTSMQTQLFVCESFEQLIEEVNHFGNTMAFRQGGTEAIEKAIASSQVAHIEYNSGLQITGLFTELLKDSDGEAIYVKTSGPSALSVQNKQLAHHGKEVHLDGFGAPIGKLLGGVQLEAQTEQSLKELGVEINQKTRITFESGVELTGHVTNLIFHQDTLILITLEECLVTYKEEVLFDPSWGTYDLAVGSQVVSARPIAADHLSYYGESIIVEEEEKAANALTLLEELYLEVRQIREATTFQESPLQSIVQNIMLECPEEWLLQLEILELLEKHNPQSPLKKVLLIQIEKLKQDERYVRLIQNGLDVIYNRRTMAK
ncbi:phenylalanine 4-monooxygenase [Alkalihalobacillus alcalophilus ATCC 27647 = CGMCC 1.3604]|uniref:Phenylalanine 4-monooxygenase n=1 Tax=Alkalihalobacillus alcalophilus ATCC 27647 = CGMCC 1.3604 TaxID=1218173 RepID=A0A094XJI0_ALKAL|nr:aromatic amino acid hydroxylase [Alkalihalobacillus alcalophilus]KGA98920.1 phenylalanine 4-monooxygenase [Alkalihalobacillus alcalophilus ATCC 27647 = CGMCC 1.3604]MED1561952.1 aromatic amino acid hydroxylase [Alkalihalobacillus alcalophilus]THG88459.1 phenylalanine 4-monooxygenase [Alkalihalobacillus alcalophilus ATCC 27647 = CGMCC 1.3604]